HRGIETEDDADPDGHTDRDDHRSGGDQKHEILLRRDALDDLRDAPAEQDPKRPAEAGERDALDEELRQDVAASRAHGLADPDLAGPLVHRDEHDVHDPDASDEEADAADRAEQERERPGHLIERSEEHTSELQSRFDLVCRLLLEKKKKK